MFGVNYAGVRAGCSCEAEHASREPGGSKEDVHVLRLLKTPTEQCYCVQN